MTLPPVHQPTESPTNDQPYSRPAQDQLDPIDLEILAEKVINMIKRELQLDNEREGRLS